MMMKKLSEDHYIVVDDSNKEMYTIPTSEAKELIGDVNKVEELSLKMGLELYVCGNYDFENGVRKGYNQALEDNKDKKYTEEDMRKMWKFGYNERNLDDSIESFQHKTEWEVEFVDGKLKLKS